MATISKIKVGQVLYDKRRYKMGHTTMTTWGVWPVFVKEVDPNGEFIIASWNGNKPRRMFGKEVSKLRVKEPILNK